MAKRRRPIPKQRETTARFNTEECRILLRAWDQVREKGLIFPTCDEEYVAFLKIRQRLEERIDKEDQKNKRVRLTNGKIKEDYPAEVIQEIEAEAAFN
jgi:hypothetical protein